MNERKTEFAAFEGLRLCAHSFLAGVPLRTLQRVELLRNRSWRLDEFTGKTTRS